MSSSSSSTVPTAHQVFPGQLFCYGTVSSVLDVAKDRVREGRLDVWDSVLAARQTQGRGQYRRVWSSPEGNLYAALRLPLAPPFSGLEAAPAIGALVAEGLEALGVPIRLKWPNDLMVEKAEGWCKIGGILLEEAGGILLAGIGINIVASPPISALRNDAAAPAAHIQELVPDFTRFFSIFNAQALWNRLVSDVYFWYNEHRSYAEAWRERAEARLLWRAETVCWHDGAHTLRGKLVGLGVSGGARLLLPDGRTEEVLGGSLSPAAI